MPSEADTCRKHVVPLVQSAGWDNDPHSIAEQRTITDGSMRKDKGLNANLDRLPMLTWICS
jgi:hypothetical protein